MKLKKRMTFISAAIGVTSIVVPSLAISASNNNKTLINDFKTVNKNAATYTNYYSQGNMETITNVNGPILLKDNGSKVVSMDWYGNINWEYSVSELDTTDNSTKIVDWNYMDSHDWLYLITDKSFIIKIISTTGSIAGRASKSASGVKDGSNRLATISFNNSLYVWNSTQEAPDAIQIDRNTLKQIVTTGVKAEAGYLVDILPIAVGYNIGVFSNKSVVDANQFNNDTITLKFIDDNLKKISNSTETTISGLSNTTTYKDFATYSFQRSKNTTSPLIIVDKKAYSVILNKTSMANSSINEVTIASGHTNNNNWINSAFMDENDTVYFKTFGETKIYTINYNNNFIVHTELNSSNNTTLQNIVNNSNNNVQIFGVAETGKSQNIEFGMKKLYSQDTLWITSSENSYITGMREKRVENSDYSILKPGIQLKASSQSRFVANVPSIVTANDFSSTNADALVGNQVTFKANDLTGELIVRATLTKSAWYSNQQKTTSIVKAVYDSKVNIKPKKLSDLVKWADDRQFSTQFGKYTPSQLVEADLNKWSGLITTTGIQEGNNFKNVSKNVVITNRVDTNGQITLQGVVSYTDRHNNFVSYTLQEKTYTITPSTGNYSIKFYGGIGNATGTTQNQPSKPNTDISMDNVPNAAVKDMQKYLPSMISWDQLPLFLEKEESYVPSHRNMISTYNDDAGTLTIELTYGIIDANKIPNKFIQTYTGFTTSSQANINWQGSEVKDKPVNQIFKDATIKDITSIGAYNDLKNTVANQVQANQLGQIYDTKLSRMGYVPKISIEKMTSLDNEYGSFIVTLDYSGDKTDPTKLKQAYKNMFGLTNFKISQRYSGMLPIGELYGITLDQNSAKAKRIIQKYDVDSAISTDDIISTLDIKGYKLNQENPNNNDSVTIQSFTWDGEKFVFTVFAQSKEYSSVSETKNFTLDWAPKFKAIRERNMVIAIVTSILGVIIVSTAITLYIFRRNRIRRLLK